MEYSLRRAKMFYPENSVLGTVLEYQNFSYPIYYEVTTLGVGGVGGTATRYPVQIVFNQTNPPTVSKINGDPATIFGYFYDSFDNNLQYRTPQDNFVNVKKFEEINQDALSEMIYYLADTRRTIDYTYTANAMDGNNIVASKIYTITVQNDWTNGKNTLQTYVGYTR
jgi:hypothetical protein